MTTRSARSRVAAMSTALASSEPSVQASASAWLLPCCSWRRTSRSRRVIGSTSRYHVSCSRPATCGQAQCDQYAFQQADLDWQIWIEKGDKPVPRKVVITTLYTDVQPRFSANLDWTINPALDDATFVFTPPAESYAIPIVTASK